VHGVLCAGPAAEHDRSDPDQIHAVHPVEQGDLLSSWLASTRPGVGQAKVGLVAADDSHVVETPLTALSCLENNDSVHGHSRR
jgi:hypothetical protein